MDLMECPICLFLMCEPVTMGCGHSFCRRCLGSYLPSRCPACKEKFRQRDAKHNKNNVLLISVIEKCCPEETKMKCHIQEKLKASEFTEALRMADEGIELAPDDVSLKVWHAEANLGLRRFSDALRDLDELCGARPSWTEGFFRKGNALLEMGRQTEALLQFHHCLRQQADFAPAKASIKKILEAEGMSVPDEVPEILQLVSDFLQQPCPITSSVDTQQGDRKRRASEDGDRGRGDLTRAAASAKLDSSTECCLSLCQAVSFLPTAEDDEEPMMTKEERHSRASCSVDRQSSLGVLTVSDFECPLCIRLFYEPVTTPCGHTFCKNCIERSLDHNLRCPLCKQPLQEYLKNRKYNPTVLLQDIMSRLFPSQLAERKQVHDTEMAELSNLTTSVPIFVCTVAYPGIPCPLHVFEPRYRLMIRRSMESGTKQFGMCIADDVKGFADYGCMLEVKDVKFFPDGRSVVDTVGVSRFKVLSHGQRDGYHTAKIEYLQDKKVEGEELAELLKLHDSVYDQANAWFTSLKDNMKSQILSHFGHLPVKDPEPQADSSGPAWCWWLLAVLPLENRAQLTILAMTSLKDRLIAIRRVLIFVTRKRAR